MALVCEKYKPDPQNFHYSHVLISRNWLPFSGFTKERDMWERDMFDVSFHLHDFLFILYDFVIYKVKCLKCERKIVV